MVHGFSDGVIPRSGMNLFKASLRLAQGSQPTRFVLKIASLAKAMGLARAATASPRPNIHFP